MHVIATAGHVDHGKSTLVRRLTGMEPDRWAEERRRGLTIGLGFAWTTIGDTEFAFVDVPGHERFVGTMMAGVGPVPAVMFVVAADGGWMPQSAEHLAVLEALQVRHGILVITRADLADPEPALGQAQQYLDFPAVIVSPDHGIEELRATLTDLRLPQPDTQADVRLWIDRSFTIDGAGTVVTGTLAAGTISVGDELVVGSRTVRVKGIHTLGRQAQRVTAVARVALNLRGVERSAIRHGDALCTPDAWTETTVVDVRVHSELTRHLVLHIGSAAVPVHVRPLGTHAARLRLRTPLPLRIGDRVVLRDPGRHEIAAGADVLDIDPPALSRRGDARRRAADLGSAVDLTAFHLAKKGSLRPEDLRKLGLSKPDMALTDGWYVDADRAAALMPDPASGPSTVRSEVDKWDPLSPMPLEALRQRLDLPDIALAATFARRAGFTVHEGRITTSVRLPAGIDQVVAHLKETPFRPPDAGQLRELGIGPKEIAAAVRAGALIKLADSVVLLPDALDQAIKTLTGSPFTPTQAKQALGSTRRVVIPLLERLDALSVTEHHPDGTRTICAPRVHWVP
ncbi:selenocysteine-specific translation elongation factor [Kibdelosporangium philippinense]|uniref:Selenocysteine-specific elongation factor n=1 Tax=Kibdelosporangium philippinense TaxID=211113 RepID=A0ABS8Z3P7_9PSEU|nr:selenocysteine-specific translation elongation factor [Kibdelosporangium philippinense]MCE7002554.1 selenocysteine-specific translation elongation factor [Kibdelosporangium philippinense]